MPAVVTELKGGWSLSATRGIRRYRIEGAADIDEAREALLDEAVPTWYGLPRADPQIEVSDDGVIGGLFVATVPYESSIATINGFPRRVQISLEISPSSFTVFKTKEGTYATFGSAALDYQGQIGVNGDGSVTGAEIECGILSFEATFEKTVADFTDDYVQALFELATPNHVNAAVVTINIGTTPNPVLINFPARTLRYRGARTNANDHGSYTVNLSLCAAPPISDAYKLKPDGAPDETVTVTADGHDVVWFDQVQDGSAGALRTLPRAAYTHKVYPDGDFDRLEIPA